MSEKDSEKNHDGKQEHHSRKKISHVKKVRENPWIISSVVLGILILVMLISGFGCNVSGNAISEADIGPAAVGFVNTELLQGQGSVTLSDVSQEDGFYKVVVDYNGQSVPVYFTKDGYYMGSVLASVSLGEDVSDEKVDTSVTPSDNPSAELYIWSYCPYGVTALGPFAQSAELLGDYADFKVYLYYAGHGEFEVQQNKIQACIQELGYEDEYWEYARTFADEIYEKCYGDADCDLAESTALMDSLGIDSDEVLSCVENQGETLLEEHYDAAKELGVTGSPSLIVNGVKVSSSRTAEAFKNAICTGFTEDSLPEECGQELDSTGTTATGSC